MERKYHGIREAIHRIHLWDYNNGYPNGHIEIAYDPTEDEVLCSEHVGSSYTAWQDGIIRIGDYAGKQVTMKQIKADIEQRLSDTANNGVIEFYITDGYKTMRIHMIENGKDVAYEFFNTAPHRIRCWEYYPTVAVVTDIDLCIEMADDWEDEDADNRKVEYKTWASDTDDAIARLRHADQWHDDLCQRLCDAADIDPDDYDGDGGWECILEPAMKKLGVPSKVLYGHKDNPVIHGAPGGDYKDDSFTD